VSNVETVDVRHELATPPICTMSPRNADEALDCMSRGIAFFHEQDDFRAVFLTAYQVITEQMQGALHDPAFFCDPEWMSRVIGTFATFYFRSLQTFESGCDEEHAWKVAHGLAIRKHSTVLQDVLLGVNAHIKYDLPQALEVHLREQRGVDRELAFRRKDHERADLVLTRSISLLQQSIPRTYGGSLRVFDRSFLRLDALIASFIGPYHRRQVWVDAVGLARAQSDTERRRLVRKINNASGRTAEIIKRWFVPRWLGVEHTFRLRDLVSLTQNAA
jgi:hypothetical protein